jgi:hypothetical protein
MRLQTKVIELELATNSLSKTLRDTERSNENLKKAISELERQCQYLTTEKMQSISQRVSLEERVVQLQDEKAQLLSSHEKDIVMLREQLESALSSKGTVSLHLYFPPP